MTKKYKVTLPHYFKEFKCIGGKCEDSCCIGWDIDIDERTYADYKEVKDSQFNVLFKNNMYINNQCSNENIDYAKIKLNEDKRCPFLDSCDYCTIHSELGEESLSNTCSHFPRVMNKVDEKYEISLDVACIEAARIVLSQNDSINFESSEVELNKYIIAGEIDTEDEEYEGYPIKYFKEIRSFCMDIITNRNFDLSSRLYILGDFLFRLEEKADEDCSSVCKFINSYDVDEAGADYERNDLNYIMQLSLLDNIVNSLDIYNETDSRVFREYTKEALDGFGIESSDQLEEDSDRYIDAFVDYSREYMQKYSYIF